MDTYIKIGKFRFAVKTNWFETLSEDDKERYRKGFNFFHYRNYCHQTQYIYLAFHSKPLSVGIAYKWNYNPKIKLSN